MAKNFTAGRFSKIHQTEKAREDQVLNNAGGYVFEISPMQKLNRFCILGSTQGTYYVDEKTNVRNGLNYIKEALDKCGKEAVDEIIRISDEGLAQKQDATLFAYAVAASHSNAEVRKYALANLSKVCRIATHLFTFLTFVKTMRGFGRGLKNAIANWYNDMENNKLAVQVCKYNSRSVEGELPWNHCDVLRISHPTTSDKVKNSIYKYATKDTIPAKDLGNDINYIIWHEKCKNATTEKEVIEAIKKGKLSHESIPTNFKNSASVWNAILENGMGYTALIRNLNKLTSVGVISPLSDNLKKVVEQLSDEEGIKKARLHPINILIASRQYANGYGKNLSWVPIPQIKSVLEDAFYKSFKYVEPSGKNILIGLDVSGSMYCGAAGNTGLTCCEAGAAIALTIAKTEKNYHILGFCDKFVDLKISDKDTLESATKKAQKNNFGSTDCAVAIDWAMKNPSANVDAIVIITDNETYMGGEHVFTLLNDYRKKVGKKVKLIVLGMEANPFTISDPNDIDSLDICGMSSEVPSLVSNFIKGK